MKTTSPLPILALRKRKNPGFNLVESIVDLFPSAALLVDLEKARILAANSKASEITSFTRQELDNLNIQVLFPRFEQPIFQEEAEYQWDLPMTKRNGAIVDVRLSLTRLDSNYNWALISLEPFYLWKYRETEAKRQLHIWEALRELATSPQQVENPQALKLALQTGSALTGAPILVIYQGVGSNYVLKRTAMHGPAEMLPEQINPHDLVSLQTPEFWTPKKRALASLHRAARASNLTYLASAPLGQSNALIGILAIAGDEALPGEQVLNTLQVLAATITTIIQNQSLSRTVEKHYQDRVKEAAISAAIKESVQDGLVVITPDLTVQDLNPAAEAILGYASREASGVHYRSILVGTENLMPAFVSSQPGIMIHDLGNIKLYRRDGEIFLAHVRTLPIVVEDHLERLIVLIQDLSQQEQFRAQNQQLEQRALLGEVIASFAHEVRNPINNISTGLQLMSRSFAKDDPNQEAISRLEGDCERVAELMKSVLAFAKPVEYLSDPVDLELSIRRLIDRARPNMAKNKVQHIVQVETGTPKVLGDQRALEQVWINLINNGIQAMEQNGGTLAIKIRPVTMPDNTSRVEVSISDTGTGIPDDIIDRIFEPFFTTKRNGTGLGLAITKQIITAHKGSIRVSSIPGGTVFQVQLPLANQ